jgi:hypothetical protein
VASGLSSLMSRFSSRGSLFAIPVVSHRGPPNRRWYGPGVGRAAPGPVELTGASMGVWRPERVTISEAVVIAKIKGLNVEDVHP